MNTSCRTVNPPLFEPHADAASVHARAVLPLQRVTNLTIPGISRGDAVVHVEAFAFAKVRINRTLQSKPSVIGLMGTAECLSFAVAESDSDSHDVTPFIVNASYRLARYSKGPYR